MVACVYRWFNVNNSTLSMLHHLPRSFPQHHPILRYALDTYYGCLQSSYICGHNGFRYLCCSTNSAMLPHWLSYMVFCKQRSITYFARKPSRVMITCSQGVRYLYYSTNSTTTYTTALRCPLKSLYSLFISVMR
ncbi:uncharacterized protein LOC126873823 isoform X4 [Bombus huntii]|uniref:uncharacterized protein LOC126873823 isoform X4 n=1 Tax=Bombus huntii TaxID=85661 RepID=UPI0021AA5B50|nr:uncharacterized protein LOC126873823 isoform X4 [Bombus huntii]